MKNIYSESSSMQILETLKAFPLDFLQALYDMCEYAETQAYDQVCVISKDGRVMDDAVTDDDYDILWDNQKAVVKQTVDLIEEALSAVKGGTNGKS